MADERLIDETNKETSEPEDVETLKKALAKEKALAEANLAGWQRAQADFTNYKRRTEQEKEETIKFAGATLILSLLPVLDDFGRAYSALPADVPAGWVDGVRLIERKLKAILEAQGLAEIEAVGNPFDPHLHEAIKQDKGEEGIVIQEMEKGYKLHGKVLLPSKVVVGNGEES